MFQRSQRLSIQSVHKPFNRSSLMSLVTIHDLASPSGCCHANHSIPLSDSVIKRPSVSKINVPAFGRLPIIVSFAILADYTRVTQHALCRSCRFPMCSSVSGVSHIWVMVSPLRSVMLPLCLVSLSDPMVPRFLVEPPFCRSPI